MKAGEVGLVRALEVLEPGRLSTVQDRGRVGQAHLGVGTSGPADRGAAELANRLVANPASAAVLEVTLGGLELRATGAVTVAVTGAVLTVEVDGVAAGMHAPLALTAGAVLRLGRPVAGLRTYVAVRGGVRVPAVLGSRSYDVLARLGPPPLSAGDVLPVGSEPSRWPDVDVAARPGLTAPYAERSVRLRGWFGPHEEALAPGEMAALVATVWSAAQNSDRSGLSLSGPSLRRRTAGEWPPEGLVTGAVQLPPSGQPVVMLADHPVTGGYPVVAVLDRASCDRAAQVRPGEEVRLLLAEPAERDRRVSLRQPPPAQA